MITSIGSSAVFVKKMWIWEEMVLLDSTLYFVGVFFHFD